MANRASERRVERIAQGLCIYCGVRPSFWGRRCIICRQAVAKDPLPQGARTALRLGREAKRRLELEERRRDVRKATLTLLLSNKIQGKRADALRLYVGIDDGKWRTYREVAELMSISGERVRQLLQPSKLALGIELSDRSPWRPVSKPKVGPCEPEVNKNREASAFLTGACMHSRGFALKIEHIEPYRPRQCDLPDVGLLGVSVYRCQICHRESPSIPRIVELQKMLARVMLLKPAALTGRDVRFLRTITGLSTAGLAEQMGVTSQTLHLWEVSNQLRYRNDLLVRMVIASLSFEENHTEILRLLRGVRNQDSDAGEITAHWLETEGRWSITSALPHNATSILIRQSSV